MMNIFCILLVVLGIICVFWVNRSSGAQICPTCVNTCPVQGCECTDSTGNVLIPKPNPPQPPRPAGCAACIIECPLYLIECLTQTPPCTDAQLKTYVRKCLPCVFEAGCKQIGCDCLTCRGAILTPPTNPAQPPITDGCPVCDPVLCPKSLIKCAAPILCTADQLVQYVPIK